MNRFTNAIICLKSALSKSIWAALVSILVMAQTAKAITDCDTITHSFPLSGEIEVANLFMPRFPHALGTLKGYSIQFIGTCGYSGGFENIGPSSFSVVPSARCEYWTTFGPGLSMYAVGQSFLSSASGGPFAVSPYDGVTDYAGMSGTKQTLATVFNEKFINPLGFPAQSHSLFVDSWSSAPVPVSVLLPFGSDRFMKWTSMPPGFGGAKITTNWGVNAILSFSYMYQFNASSGADCDQDGVSDRCEILLQGAMDSNQDDTPDSCQASDCNNNLIADLDEIENGAPDCNANFVLDSCEIASDPALDAAFDFANDGILDQCQGLVRWSKPADPMLGIRGAKIEVYSISGTESDPVFGTIPPEAGGISTLSGDDGKFIIPREYFTQPLGPSEIGRGIRASIDYTDDTGFQVVRRVSNYPNWDPLSPVRAGYFDSKIYFPPPVVFQAGVLAEINKGGVHQIRRFLTLDQTASNNEAAESKIKRGEFSSGLNLYTREPIPAFLFFAIPSGAQGSALIKNDGVAWGYNNNPRTASASIVHANAFSLEAFIVQKVKPQLDLVTSGLDSWRLPLNIAAHSYGGLIARKWLTLGFSYPTVDRFVSFDAPHGGTTLGNSIYWGSWFHEFSLNGMATGFNQAPQFPGWNASHKRGTNMKTLLFSNVNDSPIDFIRPYTTPFGIGRTMLYPILGGGPVQPNGHCGRFIGGWELEVFSGNHYIQNYLPTIVSAGRFFAYGTRPGLGDDIDPDGVVALSRYSKRPDDAVYMGMCSSSSLAPVVPPSVLQKQLSLVSGGQSQAAFEVDSVGLTRIEAVVVPASATLNVFSSSGLQLVKQNVTTRALDTNSGYYTSFDVNMPSTGQRLLRLSASSAAQANFGIFFPNDRFLQVETDQSAYQQSASVIVRAKLQNSLGQTILPTAGSILVTLRQPDNSSISLTLFDDGQHQDQAAGDGIFAQMFSPGTQSGFYLLDAEANLTVGGVQLQRSAVGGFQVLSNAASLVGNSSQYGVDSNSNGEIDGWSIGLSVNAQQAGVYLIAGDLADSSGDIETLTKSITVSAGSTTTHSLDIPLGLLHSTSTGGPYMLKAPRIIDPVQGQLISQGSSINLNLPVVNSIEPPPAPKLTQILPSFAPYVGGTRVVLTGSSLATATSVKFAGVAAQFSVISDDSLEVVVPPGPNRPVLPPGPLPIIVRVKTPGGIATSVGEFRYLQ